VSLDPTIGFCLWRHLPLLSRQIISEENSLMINVNKKPHQTELLCSWRKESKLLRRSRLSIINWIVTSLVSWCPNFCSRLRSMRFVSDVVELVQVFLSISWLPYQYHFSNAVYSLVHLLLMFCKCRKWHC